MTQANITDGLPAKKRTPVGESEEVFVFPVSYAQQRMWFLYHLKSDSPFYNVPAFVRLEGNLDAPALAQSFNAVIERHEILRTIFPAVDGEPVQVVLPELTLPLPVKDLSDVLSGEQEAVVREWAVAEARRPFDLEHGPLLRATLLCLSEKEHILLLTLHHIISDGWSLRIFLQELAAFYQAITTGSGDAGLAELPIQYADFAIWQREWMRGDIWETQLAYWKRQLSGRLPVLSFAADHPRPAMQTFQGARYPLSLPPDLTASLKALSQRTEVTLFVTLLTAFSTLLHRYTEQEDILIGSPIANRNRAEIEGLIGFFVNMLVLRPDLSGNPTFRALLQRVGRTTVDAYAHQDLPFEKLVEELQPERDLSRTPLFQVVFALQNTPTRNLTLPDLTLDLLEFESGVVRFDLELHLWEAGNGMRGLFVYSTDLFNEATIRQMAHHFQTLLAGIVADPECRLSDLPLLPVAERSRLLAMWRDAPTAVSRALSAPALFAAQAARTPDALAVVCGAEQITYGTLNRRANQLAHHLQALGVGLETPVGVCLWPSLDQIVALLGTWKAGGACVLLDPAYPPAQWGRILQDTGAPLLLTSEGLCATFGEASHHQAAARQIVCLDADAESIGQQDTTNPATGVAGDHLAYIFYTAGKGILVEHQSISRRLAWWQDRLPLSAADVGLHQAALALDTAVWAILSSLAWGGKLVVATGTEPAQWSRLISEQRVSLLRVTPAGLAARLASAAGKDELASLRWVVGAGPLPGTVRDLFFQCCPAEFYHVYDVPEAGGDVLARVYRRGLSEDGRLGGTPLSQPVCILDRQMQPVPPGVPGEIYVAGPGLARGYWRDEEANRQRFVDNPFSEFPGTRLFHAGERGCYRPDGTFEILNLAPRLALVDGYRVNLDEVEAALLDDPAIDAVAVLARETETAETQLVAYVVPAGAFSPEHLQAHLQTRLPARMWPRAYVPLSSLPFTAAGEVDEAALARYPVIDEYLVQRWVAQVSALPGVAQAAVAIQAQDAPVSRYHLADLLADWKNALGDGEAVSGECVTSETAVSRHPGTPEKPAMSQGGPLTLDTGAPATLPEALQRAARCAPDKGVVYVQADGSEIIQTYPALLADAERILAGLRRLGRQPQDKIIFQFDHNQDFLPAFWGCILGGFVPVPLTVAPTYEQDNSAVDKLQNAWKMLDRPLILAGRQLAPAIRALADRLNLVELQVEDIGDLRIDAPHHQWHVTQPDDLAILLLTSGSTGLPKAVMQVHRTLLSRSAGTIQMNHHTGHDISLNWMPMDHVGGIVMFHLRDVYLACQQVHVPTYLILQEPLRWLDLIDRHRITMTWAPNFAFGLVNDHASTIQQGQWDLSCLRFILNGGEAIVARTARRFLELLQPHQLPPAAMTPAWGMSETCSGVTYSHTFRLETTTDDQPFVEVGRPIPGVTVRIVDGSNRVVAEETTGRVQIQGATVTPGYYRNPARTHEAFTGDGWFDTGDLGFLRQGSLVITGRAKDVIIINGINYYCHEIEAVVEEVEGVAVSFTAACAVRDPGSDTDRLAIFFCPSPDTAAGKVTLVRKIREMVVKRVGVNPYYLIPVQKEMIPKTAIGKIQRSQLRQQFEAGEFEAILKPLDLLLGTANTLPRWFYRKVWQQKAVRGSRPRWRRGRCLLFLDQQGLGESLHVALAQQGQVCVQVERGEAFALLGNGRYRLNPGNADHYRQLLTALATYGEPIGQIFHLWTYGAACGRPTTPATIAQAQVEGSQSLLFLAQALAQAEEVVTHGLRLFVVSSHVQPVLPSDTIICEKATLLGLVKTIPQEMPGLRCRHIDLPVASTAVNVKHVLREMGAVHEDVEVAYRDGKRFITRLARARLNVEDRRPTLPFKRGGMYLLSGGLGGIGTEIARYLLQRYQTRLLLVGRTPLPELPEEAASVYREFKQQGGAVRYEAVDIAAAGRLREVVARAKTDWQCDLDGVIHLAGVLGERLLVEETAETFAAVLRPKVLGTWNLYQLLQDESGGLFMTFSSVNGFFGGATVGAYAAANAFLDNFWHYQPRRTLQHYCFSWSLWNDLGMSRHYQLKDLSHGRGYAALTIRQGLFSWLAGLHHEPAQLLIGLDESVGHIRRYVAASPYALEKGVAYCVRQDGRLATGIQKTAMAHDRFQTPGVCEIVPVATIPRTASGTVNLAALSEAKGKDREQQEDRCTLPRTEIEQTLASIWRDLLRVEEVGIYDNFFELGGHSILLIQLQSKVKKAFEQELSVVEMFNHPTISALANYLEHAESEPVPLKQGPVRSEARRKSRRRRQGLRRQHRVEMNNEES